MFERRSYLLDLTRRVPTMRTLQELLDILARYRYNEFRPFVEKELPESLDWGRLGAYCEMQGLEMVKLRHAPDWGGAEVNSRFSSLVGCLNARRTAQSAICWPGLPPP